MAVPKFYGSATGATYSPTYTSAVTALNMDMFLKTARATVGSDIRAVRLTYSYGTSRTIYLYYYKGSGTSLNSYKISDDINWSVHIAELAEWGVTLASVYPLSSPTNIVTFNPTIQDEAKKTNILYGSLNGQSQRLLKLYASVNGEAKQIYGKKNPPLPYAYVTYYTDANHTTTSIATVDDSSTFNSLCGASGDTWTVTLNGTTVNNTDIKEVMATERVTSMDTFFLRGCTALDRVDISKTKITSLIGFLWNCTNFNSSFTLPNTLTSVSYLLSGCSSFNQPLTIPSSVTSIGGNFLYYCTSFNQPLTIPSSVTSIGGSFLHNCSSFNQSLTIPSNVTSIGTSFLYNCNEMTSTVDIGSLAATVFSTNNNTLATTRSTAAMYTTGVTISGTNKSAFLARFPNRTSTPYRKLL